MFIACASQSNNSIRNNRRKAIKERRHELRKIRTIVGDISKVERKRLDGLFDLHKGFFAEQPEEKEKEDEPETINDFFEETEFP